MKKPIVSIIIPTYKRADMLPRAIESCLNQTYPLIEVVVVDDNEPNSIWRETTEDIMSHFDSESRVKYIKHDCNKNGSEARNTGIIMSSGDIITYLDDDDWYYPNKVLAQVNYLLNHPEYRAVYCGWYRNHKHILPKGEGDLSLGILSGENIIITNSIMMWKSDSIECGGWDRSLIRHQEAALLLNYFRYGGLIGRIPETLIEFDVSDRRNSINPKINNQIINYLLSNYKDLVEKNDLLYPGAKKQIYNSRYRGLMYDYIKNRDILQAIFIYIKIIIRNPLTFNILLLKDIFNRLK